MKTRSLDQGRPGVEGDGPEDRRTTRAPIRAARVGCPINDHALLLSGNLTSFHMRRRRHLGLVEETGGMRA
jgi:hypothetical protein